MAQDAVPVAPPLVRPYLPEQPAAPADGGIAAPLVWRVDDLLGSDSDYSSEDEEEDPEIEPVSVAGPSRTSHLQANDYDGADDTNFAEFEDDWDEASGGEVLPSNSVETLKRRCIELTS